MKILPPRFVKKANSFCVTKIDEPTYDYKRGWKHGQTVTWYSSREEALLSFNTLNNAAKKGQIQENSVV